jgi:hypothetical protein
MTHFFYFRFCFVMFVVLLAGSVIAQKTKPRNYVLLLDLSDRLLVPGQAQQDQALILDVFARFEQAVRRNLIINSSDCFRVVLAPQAGTSYRADEVMADLYLDMVGSIATKRQRLDTFRKGLPGRLKQLYQQAATGKSRSTDFRGCDIWQYFNEQLPTDLLPTHENVLVVLTDGYFDFEQNVHVKQRGNRATDSHRLMAQLRGAPDWKQQIRQPQVGLLPVPKRFAAVSVWVAELHPKVDHLDELDLLKAIWTKWLGEMGMTSVSCLERSALPKTLSAFRQIR